MEQKESKGINLSVRSFITAIVVIFILMVAAYALTLVVPGGTYARTLDANGHMVIDTSGGFTLTEGGIPFWKWLLSPVLVLGASGSGTLIAVIVFLLVIGGVFNSLDQCGLMKYILDKIASRFGQVRYKLMAIIMLFFMALGSMIGSFEECIPLVPIVVALSVNLGWDALTGVGMSLLAVLPMFSGAWMRVLSFVLIYGLLLLFVRTYAKKIEKPLNMVQNLNTFSADPKMDRGMLCFTLILGAGIAVILCSGFVPALQDYTMIIVAVMFLAAGVVSTLVSGMSGAELGKTAFSGVLSVLPAVVMILMASSIKFTLEQAKVLDTLLHSAVLLAETLPKWMVILFIYLIVLVMNFFIPSGSAKAFMLIPLIVPMAQIFDISTQLCVLAFAFGDGFSNVIYPTNPALLISLGLADVSYSDWFKWSWKFQALNLILTSGLLLFGLVVSY